MTRFDRLRKEALALCRSRGHKMLLFRETRYDSLFHWASWRCKVCKKEAYVSVIPFPDDIPGEAVALECGE